MLGEIGGLAIDFLGLAIGVDELLKGDAHARPRRAAIVQEHAEALLKFCKIIPCKVNLIEYNPIDDSEFQQATEDALNMYMDLLERHGITTRIRKSRGKDIDAACGQLANKG